MWWWRVVHGVATSSAWRQGKSLLVSETRPMIISNSRGNIRNLHG